MRRMVAAAVGWALCVAAASGLEISVGLAGGQAVLEFDAETDFGAAAAEFAEKFGLEGGEGCVGQDCVVKMLVTAMRQQVGGCAGSAGEGCVTRTSVSGAVYREQGRAHVAAQAAEFDAPVDVWESLRRSLLAREGRRAAAPCVPPYCDFACAIPSASFEDQFAYDFIAENDELRSLLEAWPAGRACPGGTLRPIFIGIPASEFVACAPRKYRAFQGGVKEPGVGDYAFGPRDEAEYRRAYREAYFGVTKRKAGWDCMRHYEIVASGALPFFEDDLADCPELTLAHWPKKLLQSLKTMTGVHAGNKTIDRPLLDASAEYAPANAALLYYARRRLTSEALATYVLESTGHPAAKTVLILSAHPAPDYMREMLVHGFRAKLGRGAVDFVKPQHLYRPRDGDVAPPRDSDDARGLYGHGFTYANRLFDDPLVDRADVPRRIKDKAFDVVLYASVHRGLPYFDAVRSAYAPEDVIFVDGEDGHGWSPFSAGLPAYGHYFMRELPDGCPPPAPNGDFWL